MKVGGRILLWAVLVGAVGCRAAPSASPPEARGIVREVIEPDAASLAAARAAEERARLEVEARAAEEAEEARSDALAEEQSVAFAEEVARAEAERRAFEAAYPMHGVAYHFLTQVREEASRESRVVGYIRRGSRFRASERVPGTACARGWHEVPGGGFVCRGEGYLIGSEPQSFEPSPVPPALDDALPYAYVYASAEGTPQYWRLPTVGEEDVSAGLMAAMVEGREARLNPAEAAPVLDAGLVPEISPEAPPTGEETDGGIEQRTASADEVEEQGVEAPPPPGQEATAQAGVVETLDAADGALELPNYIRMELRRGYFISVDGEETDAGRRFLRSVRGAYVRAEGMVPNQPPVHRGVVLGGAWELPVAFVYRRGVSRLRRSPSTGALRVNGQAAHLTPYIVSSTMERGRREYIVTQQGHIVRRGAVRVASRVERPEGVGPGERWIHVRLSEQSLVAYEGDTPVFATIVSTGKEGFETPAGLFRIQSKHVSTTMDDLTSEEGAYMIEDVPWTMYFEGNYALHAAFWHSSFGRVRSHGCVNLAPADARWLFQWSTPTLPASWHGIFSDRERAGTFVYIED